MKKLHQVEVTIRAEFRITVFVEDPEYAEEVATNEASEFLDGVLSNISEIYAIGSTVKEEVDAKELSTEL